MENCNFCDRRIPLEQYTNHKTQCKLEYVKKHTMRDSNKRLEINHVTQGKAGQISSFKPDKRIWITHGDIRAGRTKSRTRAKTPTLTGRISRSPIRDVEAPANPENVLAEGMLPENQLFFRKNKHLVHLLQTEKILMCEFRFIKKSEEERSELKPIHVNRCLYKNDYLFNEYDIPRIHDEIKKIDAFVKELYAASPQKCFTEKKRPELRSPLVHLSMNEFGSFKKENQPTEEESPILGEVLKSEPVLPTVSPQNEELFHHLLPILKRERVVDLTCLHVPSDAKLCPNEL